MRVIVWLLFFSHFVTLVSAQKTTSEEAGKALSREQQKQTFHITAPAGWERKDTLIESTFLTALISPSDGVGDKFRENLNIISVDVEDLELEEYFENSRKEIYALPDIKIIDQRDSVVNSMTFKILRYTSFIEEYEAEVLVYLTLIKGKSYVITCGCLKGQMNVWQKPFEDIISTFKVD